MGRCDDSIGDRDIPSVARGGYRYETSMISRSFWRTTTMFERGHRGRFQIGF